MGNERDVMSFETPAMVDRRQKRATDGPDTEKPLYSAIRHQNGMGGEGSSILRVILVDSASSFGRNGHSGFL